ncbi:MAG: RDD family protein [Alphaproteobacteria bacterium]|nr:RDD family protein [Alphaproteobacteria bacterium]
MQPTDKQVEETVLGNQPTEEEAPKAVAYAGFNARMMASTIDSLLGAFLLMPVFNVGSYIIVGPLDNYQARLMPPANFDQLPQDERWMIFASLIAEFLDYATANHLWEKAAMNYAFQFLVVGLIVVPMWMWKGATPGKMLMGMRVVNAETLEKPSLGRGVVRYSAYLVSLLPLLLGMLWIGWNRKKRGWHDMIAGTVVIKDPETPFSIKFLYRWVRSKLKRD